MQGLTSEAASFAAACLAGMTAACVYACIRRLRRVVPHSFVVVAAEDAVYWAGMTIYIFIQIFHTSSGSIRGYFVIGAALGAAFFWLAEKALLRLADQWCIRRGKGGEGKKS